MSDRDLVISRSAELENILKSKFGAEGKGLGQQVISIQHLLSNELYKKVWFVVGIRNKAAHEVNFQLYNREKFVRECDDVLSQLTDLDASSIGNKQSVSNNNSGVGMDFYLNPDLTVFKYKLVTYLIDVKVIFSYITGKIVGIKERNYSVRSGKEYVDKYERKIWIQCSDGLERCIEFNNVNLAVRQGQTITVLSGTIKNRSYTIALYIHEMVEYYRQTDSWNTRLFWPVFSWSCSGLLVVIPLLFLMRQYLIIPILMLCGVSIIRGIIFKEFEAHIVKIFQFERPVGGGYPQQQQTNVANEPVQAQQVNPLRGEDLKIELTIELREAAFGGEKEVRIPHLEKCDACQGNGRTSDLNVCQICNGDRRVMQTKKLLIDIPPGVDNDSRLRVGTEGDAGLDGGESGDLYVYLSVNEDPHLRRNGLDILSTLQIDPERAWSGCQQEIATIDGLVSLTIPPETQHGATLRLAHRGVPQLGNPTIRGHHLVTLLYD
jgi:DnaJ C terminal domain